MTLFNYGLDLVTGPTPVDAALAFAKQQWPNREATATAVSHGSSAKFHVEVVLGTLDAVTIDVVVRATGSTYVVVEWSEPILGGTYRLGTTVPSASPEHTTDKPAHAPLTADAKRRTWEEFRQAGMLTVANTVLHWFGWQITAVVDTDTSMVVGMYPERTKYRGLQRELYESGMERMTDWLVSAATSLREDIRDE